MTQTIERAFLEMISSIFNVDSKNLLESNTPEDLESWTSVTHMQLVARLEEMFKFQFDVEEITEMDSVGNIKKVLRKHGVKI